MKSYCWTQGQNVIRERIGNRLYTVIPQSGRKEQVEETIRDAQEEPIKEQGQVSEAVKDDSSSDEEDHVVEITFEREARTLRSDQ